ncbi:MAG: hypothetical protein KatS3mg062_1102 [Tepidiforma sp.]|nr:MAG: hypothetical protein KatS3mg062_1102 [Tepidiforma sp.]
MDFRAAERDFFRALNAFVEPAVRAGLGGPCLIPCGLIVLETTGRRSGLPRRTPLLASLIDRCLVVATVRPHSHWVRNARANPSVRYWLNGREHRGRAHVITADARPALPETLPQLVRVLAENLLARYAALGWSFAVIEPGPPEPA